jgi:hypothetical protein
MNSTGKELKKGEVGKGKIRRDKGRGGLRKKNQSSQRC